jgi:ribose 5-phosphate isomerase A
MADLDREKFLAAQAAVELVEDGMTVGLGTGSTAAHVVKLLGVSLRGGLRIRAVPTSVRTGQLAVREGIPLVSFTEVASLDLAIDGADEVDSEFQLIKGGGGALLRERIVASASKRFVVIVDSTKRVPVLGRFPLPVEVLQFAWPLVEKNLAALGGKPRLRKDAQGAPMLTDERNFILDCHFGQITRPAELAASIRALPGVVDQGLFIDYPDTVIIGSGEAVEHVQVPRPARRRSP